MRPAIIATWMEMAALAHDTVSCPAITAMKAEHEGGQPGVLHQRYDLASCLPFFATIPDCFMNWRVFFLVDKTRFAERVTADAHLFTC